MEILKTKKGQATLSLVFLIGGVALLIAVTLSLISISFLNSTFAFQAANRAMAMAISGADDAILTLDRNNTFSSSGYAVCAADCANVTVTRNTPMAGQTTILSTATVFASQRKIQIVVSINPLTGEVTMVSSTMLTL